MILLITILYILIACIIGSATYVFNDDDDEVIGSIISGIFWPGTVLLFMIFKIIWFICNKLCKIFEYLKNEGFHYCKENIESCCGQCKYLYYCNNSNEINNCHLINRETEFCSLVKPCKSFKKHWLWRFKIRYNWNK